MRSAVPKQRARKFQQQPQCKRKEEEEAHRVKRSSDPLSIHARAMKNGAVGSAAGHLRGGGGGKKRGAAGLKKYGFTALTGKNDRRERWDGKS